MGSLTTATSYILSRFAFLLTHADYAYFLLYLTNDPLNFGVNTLDASETLPEGQCTSFDTSNFLFDLGLFALWWGTHSLLARKAYKVAVGLWDHPLERPIFAAVAATVWFINIHYWKPVNNCTKFDALAPSYLWILSGAILVIATFEIVGLLWSLPNHVFGTDRYKYAAGAYPHGKLITGFPYNLVRHPAAAGFLWIYWLGIPSFTVNHAVLTAFWTAFIAASTLLFEEGGLEGEDEFGKKYRKYKAKVNAFVPSTYSLGRLFGVVEDAFVDINDSSEKKPHHEEKKVKHA